MMSCVASTEGQVIEGLITQLRAAGVIHDVDNARLMTEGMQHLILVIDDELIARFPRNVDARRALRDEHRVLSHLGRHVSAPLPQTVAWTEDFFVYRMLRGEPITRAALARLDRRRCDRLIDDVADFLADMHSAPLPDEIPASPASKPPAAWLGLRDRANLVVTPLLWRHQREWLGSLFRPIETGELSFDFAPAMIHGDLGSYHLLHDPSSALLTGILDFGVAGRGDPAVDLGCLLCVWGERWASGLVRRYPQLADLADRARFIAHALPVEWAVIGLEQDQPDMLVAHLGHAAADLSESGAPFMSAEHTRPTITPRRRPN
jgi:aminoglycoside 2''-phosphotransferase